MGTVLQLDRHTFTFFLHFIFNMNTTCAVLQEALIRTGIYLISPVPRCVYTKCCSNAPHIENFEDPKLDEEIVAGLEGI
jgi:hypothetical protein